MDDAMSDDATRRLDSSQIRIMGLSRISELPSGHEMQQQQTAQSKAKQRGCVGDVKRRCKRRVFVAFAKRSGELEEATNKVQVSNVK